MDADTALDKLFNINYTSKELIVINTCQAYLEFYNLSDWTVALLPADSKANGRCVYRSKQILISRSLIEHNNFQRINSTVLHEIAHALVGANHGHDSVWRAKSAEIGGSTSATNNSKTPMTERGYKWYLLHGDEIIGGWRRKPKHMKGYAPKGQMHLAHETEVVSVAHYELLYT